MSVDIGGRLRFVRARHKLSQRELAKRSGVTNSTISLIESNQMNPSVGALKRILDGLPMGLAEFFAIEPERPRKAFYRADELTEIGKKPISFRQVGDNLFGRSLQILKERYEPGSGFGHIALEVQDAHAACAQIAQRGGKVVRPAGPMKHGRTVIAFVEDPDGYKIELIEKKVRS